MPLQARGIKASTCQLAGYGIADYKGSRVQVADYRDDEGRLVAQKIKTADKQFQILGNGRNLRCWQIHRHKGGGKRVPIFEGETDCLAWIEMYPKYPAVSVPSGAPSAAKAVARDIAFFESFEEVIICMDNDDPGHKAAIEIAALFSPGKAKIMLVPPAAKDVCDAIGKGLRSELVEAFWNAKAYRPDGIVTGQELIDIIVSDKEVPACPYPWVGLNEKLHGLRQGELVTVCAGTGVGKSQVCRSLAVHLIKQGHRVGYIALEEGLARTGLSLLGLVMGKPLHLDKSGVTEESMREAFTHNLAERLFVYNHFGSLSAENLLARCRYLRVADKCDYLIVDHLSILVSGWGDGDERRLIDNVMTALRSQVCEATGVGMVLVSHLKRVEGKSAERGAEPELSHLRGSQAISQLSDACIALSRDTMGEDPHLTTVRVIKNRFSGELGVACHLRWSPETGLHQEVSPEFEEKQEVPF
jgi:twinkle protein